MKSWIVWLIGISWTIASRACTRASILLLVGANIAVASIFPSSLEGFTRRSIFLQ